MRELTGDQLDVVNSNNRHSFFVLKVGFTSGECCYCDSFEQTVYPECGTLVSINNLTRNQKYNGVACSEGAELCLADTDGALRDKLDMGEFIRCPFILNQCFISDEALFEVTILKGIFTGEHQIESDMIILSASGGASFDMDYLFPPVAAGSLFPYVPDENSGSVLPAVYGSPGRIKAMLAQQPPSALLTTLMDRGCMEFFVDDASCFPEGIIYIRIGYEWVKGSFSGNKFTVSERGALESAIIFGSKTGNPSILRIADIEQSMAGLTLQTKGHLLKGLYIEAEFSGTKYVRLIAASHESGLVNIVTPFSTSIDGFVWPAENSSGRLLSLPRVHNVGETVSLLGVNYIYAVLCAAVSGLELIEGRTGNEYYRLEESEYDVIYNDTVTFPEYPSPLVTLSAPWPPQEMDMRVERDEVYLTLDGAISEGNPVDIIQDVLGKTPDFELSMVDTESFSFARQYCANTKFSFVLLKQKTISALIADLCFQSKLCYIWCDGKLCLQPLKSSISVGSDIIVGNEHVYADSEFEEENPPNIKYIKARYRDGYVYVGDPLDGGVELSLDLWAFSDAAQARTLAEWWLQRLQKSWRRINLDLSDVAGVLDLNDTITVDTADGVVSGFVERVSLKADKGPTSEQNYSVTLSCPVWSGCTSSCEAACESGNCESGTCESSCTVDCELSCQNACMTAVQSYPNYIKACTRSCQLSCRAQTEGTASCTESCETGCEASCEGMAFEVVCESGCESYAELFGDTDILIKRGRVVVAVSAQYGELEIQPLLPNGDDDGYSISAHDYLDINPAVGGEVVVVCLANGDWMIANSGRPAKFVKVISDNGNGSYEVIECDHTGNSRGQSFTAYSPPSS